MESYPSWNEWKSCRVEGSLVESKGQAPNYSFDNWLKHVKGFGDEISSFVGQAKVKDKELDDEIEKKNAEPEKEPVHKDDDDDDAGDKSKDKEAAWKKLRDIAKERMEKNKEKAGKKESV